MERKVLPVRVDPDLVERLDVIADGMTPRDEKGYFTGKVVTRSDAAREALEAGVWLLEFKREKAQKAAQ